MRTSVFALSSGCVVAAFAASIYMDASPLLARQQSPTGASGGSVSQYNEVMAKYCVTCHNSRAKIGGLTLDRIDASSPAQHVEVLEKVVRKLRSGDMPPAGRPRPDQATYDTLRSWLESSLDTVAATKPNPGRPALHRLNRTEYANAVRDLLALDVDAPSLLPADNSTRGFDNIADALGMSPLLLESYVTAARKISRMAMGDPGLPPISQTYRGAHDQTQDYHQDGMPFGSRGGLSVRHHFPVDGEYEIRIRLERSQRDDVRGLQEPHDMELVLDGRRINLFHLDGGPHLYEQKVYDGESPALFADDGLVLKVPVTGGPHEITATFPAKAFLVAEDLAKPLLRSYRGSNDVKGLPAVSKIIVTGPYSAKRPTDTPSRSRIFSCVPGGGADDAACAKRILSTLARRAYRGMSTDADVQELLGFYQTARRTGGFEDGIESALWRILSSPKFVFRFEFDPATSEPGAAYRISDLELASRLSFFLWSSIPDDQLLDAAARRELQTPAGLDRQVRRMLADARSKALVDNFAGQWLYLRNLENVVPDTFEFPNFDNNLRHAFRRETELLFDAIVREDRSVLDLLNADYTFVNERLARHYGVPNVRGSDFRRVSVTDERRRGILGHGSILTVTSYANRTSPVLRGKWVMENILGTPPPPPPPDVPDLPENSKRGGKQSIRERMSEHRANPVCASCHSKMDPIGFGMENFDAIGAWRTTEAKAPIDASGTLPNGVKFNGPAELRQALLRNPEDFVATMTSKLLTYALGRGVEYYDAPAVRAITRAAARTNYTFSSVVLGIVKSVPFKMRRVAEQPAPVATPGPRHEVGAAAPADHGMRSQS
jgi:mono/diheme cytochrome c family protein